MRESKILPIILFFSVLSSFAVVAYKIPNKGLNRNKCFYPVRFKPTWKQTRTRLDSIRHALPPKEFVQYLREHVYKKTPTLSTGGEYFKQYFGEKGWPGTAEKWHDIAYEEILGSICGDYSNHLMTLYHEFGFRAWTLSIGKPDFTNEQGHMQTIVEVIDTFHSKLDTVLSVQDAEFNFTYFDRDSELIDLRDIIRLWLMAKGKDSIWTNENNTIGLSLLNTPQYCECCDEFVNYQGSRQPRQYLGLGIRKFIERDCFDATFTDTIPFSYGYGRFELKKTSDFSHQYYFIRDIANSNGTDERFLDMLDSIKLLYGFIPWRGIVNSACIADLSSGILWLDSSLAVCHSFKDSLLTLLFFAHNEIRLGDQNIPLDTGYHDLETWLHLFESDAIRVDEKGEVRFFNSLCGLMGIKTWEFYAGKKSAPSIGFSVVHDPRKNKSYLLNTRFMLYFQNSQKELADLEELLAEVKIGDSWQFEIEALPEKMSHGIYLTEDSTSWYCNENPYFVKRGTEIVKSSRSAFYRVTSSRSIQNYLLKGGCEEFSHIARWWGDKADINELWEMKLIPAYCNLTAGMPDSLKNNIACLLSQPYLSQELTETDHAN